MGDFFQGPPRSRSRHSFATFYKANISTVVRILGKIGVRPADIPDIAQQVFLKVYKNWENPETGGLDVSLETICRQQATNHYRLHRHRFEQPEPNVGEQMPSEEQDAQSQLEHYELDQIVQRILDEMSPEFRDLLIRREFRKESLESIAEAHNMARNTATARIAQAKEIFRLRAERMLGDKSSWLLVLPLAMQTHNFNADLSDDFVAGVQDQVWGSLARKLGFSDEDSSEDVVRETDIESPQSKSRRRMGVTWFPWSKPLLDVLTNPIILFGAGILAGIAGTFLWPHASPAIARRMPSFAGAVIVLEHDTAKERAGLGVPSIATSVVTTGPVFESPAPQLNNELRRLQHARTLITEGKYTDALTALRKHEIDFPRSEHAATRTQYIVLAEEGFRRASASSSAP